MQKCDCVTHNPIAPASWPASPPPAAAAPPWPLKSIHVEYPSRLLKTCRTLVILNRPFNSGFGTFLISIASPSFSAGLPNTFSMPCVAWSLSAPELEVAKLSAASFVLSALSCITNVLTPWPNSPRNEDKSLANQCHVSDPRLLEGLSP